MTTSLKDTIKINDYVTVDDGIRLCREFGFDSIADELAKRPDNFTGWVFDGCSMVIDHFIDDFTNVANWEDVTMKCCLPHDLRYAYGKFGDVDGRKEADEIFENDLKSLAGMNAFSASIFKTAVRIGGFEALHTNFSWGYGRKLTSQTPVVDGMIDSDGSFWLKRGKIMLRQKCPYQDYMDCGHICPLFEEPINTEYEHNDETTVIVNLGICNDMVFNFEEFIDRR